MWGPFPSFRNIFGDLTFFPVCISISISHRQQYASAVAFDAVRLTALSYSREERGVRLANISQSDFFA